VTATGPKGGVARTLWLHPSAMLLAVQLLGLLVYPFMEDTTGGRVAFEALGIVILILVVRAINASGWVVWGAVILGGLAAAASVASAIEYRDDLMVTSGVLHAIVYFVTAGSLLRYMLADLRVSSDELYAVGATFTLVAWAFAYVYQTLQAIDPGAFTAAADVEAPRTWVELLFLSVTTLTSTGLSDIVPVTAHARSVVMVEQIAGLMYVALVISWIVGLTIQRVRRAAEEEAEAAAREEARAAAEAAATAGDDD